MISRLPVALALVAVAGCVHGNFRPGVSVPATELERHADQLDDLIYRELEAGHTERAFFILEAHKTRPYASARLMAGQSRDNLGDLRPLFASIFERPEDMVASRGIRVGRKLAPVRTRANLEEQGETLYWKQLRRVDSAFGDSRKRYGRIIRNTFATVSSLEAAALFAPGELFISYFVRANSLYAFTLINGTLESRRLKATVPQIRAAAKALLTELTQPPATRDDRSWRTHAEALHRMLLAPLPAVASATRLYVSTDSSFANVPLDVLIEPATGEPIMDRTSVTYLQSATVYRYLLQRPLLDARPRFLAVGNPTYPEGVPDLPAAAREAKTLAHLFEGGRALIGEEARESTVVEQLGEHNILHFATHGVLLGQELPGASSIMLSAGTDRDGFLSAAELGNINLSHTYLAVLSACQTSVQSGGATSDLSSIAGAFMGAGAPTVIGSLWNVSDDSTTRLMVSFYPEFLISGAGVALVRAKRALRRLPAYRHPFYWAAFVLYGWDK